MTIAPNRKAFEAAASWFVQFQVEPPTLTEQRAWQLWIDSDPAHLAAWNQMEQLQRHLGTLPPELKRRALNAGQQRRQVLKLMLLLAGTGFVGWNVQQHTSLGNAWADYKTRVGQRRSLSLADGSQIQLNTDTAIDVSFNSAQRLIRLRAGEILIQTGKLGDQRPFFVETRDGRIQALGTRFSIRQLSDSTRVGVLEDRVSVQPTDSSSGAQILKAGEGADFDSRHIGVIHPFKSSEVAWTNGQLIVLDARLGDVVRELGRYRNGILQCDERARDLRVSGTFRLDSTDAVLANLQASLPIHVRYFTRYWVSISHNG
ncbi:FecR domain-containing protein [Pseudomonas sp. B2M1-30]|uniref:FecR domain-containing protein n=1 Tax=Pseudomonas TaxID=286 RepID=UPI001C3C5511|nr:MULTISPECIES: FecR domain-containing protein [Pseudomonas]MBV4472655.1 FecR domain-containing protein [Pseudomonas botevensis]MCU0117215.1 FecR domain-containing protein [Pseudomonas sp. B2M1-30]MCU7260609.1 FecR domain-containing protein [Pseudomonas koreensis]